MTIVWKPRTLQGYSATDDGPMVVREPYAKGMNGTDDPDMLIPMLCAGAAAMQMPWGKQRIGKPKRNKARTRAAKNSRKRNRT